MIRKASHFRGFFIGMTWSGKRQKFDKQNSTN